MGDSKTRTALVLSGGGMFGAYQAGVWKALHDEFRPDIIVGCSIGSLNGWLISSGMTGAELVDRWHRLEAASQHSWRIPRRLWDGIIDASPMNELIREMYADYKPRTGYGLVATAVGGMRPALFRWPHLTWRHLACSCAVPVFLEHHRIGGVLYSDGGLLDPLPLWAAIEMGATRVVTVDVLKHRPWAIRSAVRAARAYSGWREPARPAIEVIDISPSERLGTIRDSLYWSRESAERWTALGESDAYKMKHLVVECLERV